MHPKDQEDMAQTTETQLSEPKKKSKLGYLVVLVLCVIYLLNPSSGVLEAIPDVLPVIGNLDEAAVTTALIWSIQRIRDNPQT